ncbi:hypothetical protein, partial [Methylobacterium sp. WL8]|uniref:hypothetical protein n=1 Tax=Methylobacterium sp. WL8 TaxID=2603899 RepID=UPI001AED262A
DHDFKSIFNEQSNYGIALVRPSWIMKLLESNMHIKIMSYKERAWDNHQDVCIFGLPAINAD